MRQLVRKRRNKCPPPLDEDLILSWADEHFKQYGVWPSLKSGRVTGPDGEHWGAINSALREGYRGLLLGSSLAILLLERRGVTRRLGRPNISVEDVLFRADHHFAIYGRYPRADDGIIDLAPTENWCAVNMAMQKGHRGLPGGSTLARLLEAHRGKRNKARLPKISLAVILEWADEHYQRTGHWPTTESGDVQAASCERWRVVGSALKRVLRGLPGGISLDRLLILYRGKHIRNAPISIEIITNWMRSHALRHGKYPTCKSGIVEDAPEENWTALQLALVHGFRGLPGGSSVAKLRESLIHGGKLPRLRDAS